MSKTDAELDAIEDKILDGLGRPLVETAGDLSKTERTAADAELALSLIKQRRRTKPKVVVIDIA